MKQYSYSLTIVVESDDFNQARDLLQLKLRTHCVEMDEIHSFPDGDDCEQGPLPPEGHRFVRVVSNAEQNHDSGILEDIVFYLAVPGDEEIPALNHLSHSRFQGEKSRSSWQVLLTLPHGTLARLPMWHEWVSLDDFFRIV